MNDNGLERRDDFYVGYTQDLPKEGLYARVVRRFVEILALLAVGLGVAIPLFQGSPGDGRYEDSPSVLEGVARDWPAPLLEVERDGTTSWVLLVSEFKRGAADRVAPVRGERVRVRGYRIAREGVEMLELLDGAEGLTRLEGGAREAARLVERGIVEVRGEVMDPKCYLGAMRPGEGKAHLACAARCIEGGIPPLFVADRTRTARNAAVETRHYLLVGPDGTPLGGAGASMVGVPTTLRGEWLALPGGDGSLGVLRMLGSESGRARW